MRKLMSLLALGALIVPLLVLPVSSVYPAIPHVINYQGMLTDDAGYLLTGFYDLTFGIYDDSTAGNLKWSETQNEVRVQNGLFNVGLGTETPLNLPFDEPYWLQLVVATDTMPRLRITSVGYAYRASVADSAVVAITDIDTLITKILVTPTITTSPTAAGATWTDLGSVTTADINGGTVDGTTLGATTPVAGTFAPLQTGSEGTDGELTVYSEQGGTDYSVVLQPNAAMTQVTTYTLPADDGAANQLLSTNGAGALTWTNAGAGSGDITVVGDVSTGAAFDGTSGNALKFEGATADDFEITLQGADPGEDFTLTLPAATDVLVGKATTDVLTNKTLTSPTIGTSPTAAGATWTDLGTVTTADINGGTVDGTTLGATTPAAGTFAPLQTGSDGADGQFTIHSEQGVTDYSVVFHPNVAMTENTTYTLPANGGDNGQTLTTNGTGALSWGDAGAGDITAIGDVATGAAFDGSGGNALQFEGATADDNEITLQGADAGSDVTLTLPAVTDVLVGKATTDVLTNKTLTSPTIGTSPTAAGATWTDLGTVTTADIDGGTLDGVTITSPVLNTGVSGTAVLDEDNMATNSATQLATQQSIKAYVDAQAGGDDFADNSFTVFDDIDNTKILALQTSGITTGNTRTLTVPDYDGTVATLAGTETMTNKTLTSPTIATSPTAVGATWTDLGTVTTADIDGGTLDGVTITSPVLNTGVSGTAVLDEDDMATNSDTQLATQQSIKAYVDAQAGGDDFADNSFTVYDDVDDTKILALDASGISTATTRTLTVPDYNGTVATLAGTETMTNKSLTSPTVTASPTAVGATWDDLGTVTTADINGGTIDDATIGGATPAAGTFTTGTIATADINGGAIDGTTIGATTPAAGSFTTADIDGGTIDGATIGATTPAAGSFTTADIDGGTIDGATIGGATPAAGTFTTGTIATADINGGAIDGTTIGATTPAAGSFTTADIDGGTLDGVTITSPVLNTGVSGTAVLDEDNMATNSATQLATQQSIKAYVDAQVGGGDFADNTFTVFDDLDNTKILALDVSGITTLNTRTLTVPDYNGTVATLAGTETMTNKTLTSPTIGTSPTAVGATWANLGTVTTVDINGGTIDGATIISPVLNTGVSGTAVLDEDNMATNSATQLATQQSIKAYVDAQVGGGDFADNTFTVFDDVDNTKILALDVSGITTLNTRTLTVPNYDGTIATLAGTETMTNKTLTSPTIGTSPTAVGATWANLGTVTTVDINGGTIDGATITSPVLNTGVSGTAVLDEDNMATNSATQLATQQSIKAYVDAQVGGGDFADNTFTVFDDLDNTKILALDVSGITTLNTRTLTVPNYDGTIATLAGTETMTNKTLTSPTIGTSPTAVGATWANLGTVTTADINGGTIDGATIGGATPAAGSFTTGTIATADINGGAIDGTTIGGATPAAGSFTTADIDGGTLDGVTITSPVLNTGVSGTAVLDEDNMATNSATQLATQQSIKAYVDAQVGGGDFADNTFTVFDDLDNTKILALDVSGITTLNTRTLTVPDYNGTVATLAGTETMTNKTLTSPTIGTSPTAVGATWANLGTVTTVDINGGTIDGATITSPVLNTGVSGTAVLDEDNMATNSATQLATQQSIKAYVDAQVGGGDFADNTFTVFDDLDNTKILALDVSGITTLNTRTLTVPDYNGTVATLAGTETMTNKTLTSPTIATSPTAAGATWDDLGTVTTADINGGAIDGTTIGGATPAAGSFTTADIDGGTLDGVTITSPVLNTGVSGTAVLDEDNMATNSATQLATQQSIKAYVDAGDFADNTLTVYDDGDNTKILALQTSGITTGNTRTLTVPDYDGTVATLAGTETMTNKTLTSPTIATSPTAVGATWADLGTVTTADINGGTIDGVVIGGATPAAGSFTTLTTTTGNWLGLGAAAGRIEFDDQATDEVNILDANVGIGIAVPLDKLHVVGKVRISDLTTTGATAMYFDGDGILGVTSSDRRLKENIVTIDSALKKVCRLRGVNFNMKEDTARTKKMGVIAQEIMEIVPEAVFSYKKDGVEYYGVHYAELTAILIEAMKDQNQKIEALELRLTELEKRLP